MKVLCLHTPSGPHHVRSGWGRALAACGHEFRFWNREQKNAHDIFSEYNPDWFIGTTYDLDRAQVKCIAARPQMKVTLFASAWGPYLTDLDLKQYPLVVTSEEEKRTVERLKQETGKPDFVFIHAHDRWLEGTMSGWKEVGVDYHGILNGADTFLYLGGQRRDDLVCDVGFVGGRWPYKARNIDHYLLPLCHPSTGLNVKIFGHGQWPVAQYMGQCSNEDARDLFVSATVCPNISEPHSTDCGWDLVERPYKILAGGGFCLSDHVAEGRQLFSANELLMAQSPAEFRSMVEHFVRHPDERLPYMRAGQRAVLLDHTYFDRVIQFFDLLGMSREASHVRSVKAEVVGPHLQGN